MKNNKKKYHHGNLKEVLISKALDVLKEEGLESLSLRKLANEINVSVAAPYRHFKDNEELLSEIAIKGFEILKSNLEEIVKKYKGKFLKQFQEAGIAYVEFAIQNEELFRVMYGNKIKHHSKHERLKQKGEESYQVLHDIVKNCQEKKILKKNRTDEIVLAAWSLVHGLSILIVEKQLNFSNLNQNQLRNHVIQLQRELYLGSKA
jgi:AcrR family transcriptional regulator